MQQDQLDRIEGTINRLLQTVTSLPVLVRTTLSEVLNMAISFDALTQKVTELETAQQSAIQLLGDLSTIIRNTEPTTAAINALADRLDADKTELAAAVVANTPAT
jgi:hypothetical protein